MRRRGALVLVAFATASVLCPGLASAHGADAATSSNYRTRITSVAPSRDGLTVEVIDSGGQVRLSNNTGEQVIVLGYQGEPYLRITAQGTEENLRSPATFLNKTRDGLGAVPPDVDSKAPPRWQRTSSSLSVSWHDHRTHWMSSAPPLEVRAEPDRAHVIFAAWTISLLVGNEVVTVTGDLTWIPPPGQSKTLISVGGIFGSTLILLRTRWWKPVTAGLLLLGGIIDAAATAGYFLRSVASADNRVWPFVFPALACIAAVRFLIRLRRGVDRPTLSVLASGLILVLMGGLDHLEVLSNSQIAFGFDPLIAWLAVVVELAVGSALAVNFIVFTLIQPTPRTAMTT